MASLLKMLDRLNAIKPYAYVVKVEDGYYFNREFASNDIAHACHFDNKDWALSVAKKVDGQVFGLLWEEVKDDK